MFNGLGRIYGLKDRMHVFVKLLQSSQFQVRSKCQCKETSHALELHITNSCPLLDFNDS